MDEPSINPLLQEIRELRSSIDELNGLLRGIFQTSAMPTAPLAAKRKPNKVTGRPEQSPSNQTETFEEPKPDKPGRHF